MCLFPWQHAKHEEHAQFRRCVLSLTPADLPTTSSVMCAVKVLTSTTYVGVGIGVCVRNASVYCPRLTDTCVLTADPFAGKYVGM